MWVALSRVTWERGDLVATADHLRRAADLGEAAGLPQQPYRWRVAMAQLRAAEGDAEGADALLEEADRIYSGDFSPNVRPVAATRARLLAGAGDLPAARAWVGARGLSATDELTYLREYEHVTPARILMAEHTATGEAHPLAAAAALLDRLRVAAETGERTGVLIEVLVLPAVAHDASGRREQALGSLEQAARLAEPEGWTRVFLDEQPSLQRLLDALGRRLGDRPFVRHLQAASTTRPAKASVGQPTTSYPGHELVEALSSRERDVLRLLASDLDGPAIARRLSVSLSTVRTHTQRIYTKLGASNRRAAVRRGHQLNL